MSAAALGQLDLACQSWLVSPKTQGVTGYRCYVVRLPYSCRAGALLSALCQCGRPVGFTGATHALQALSVPVKPYTESCAGVFEEEKPPLKHKVALVSVSELAYVAGPTVTYGSYCSAGDYSDAS